MKSIIALILLSTSLFAGDLKIIVKNINSNSGMIRMALWDGANGFPKDYTTSIDQISISVSPNNEMTYTFRNLKAQNYALAIFHDVNNDENLNTNALGIPKEPFGFSNNPRLIFGPPTYRKCNFKVNSSGIVTKTIYLKSF
jgi:uncharacterized protein (DUF2141 family)